MAKTKSGDTIKVHYTGKLSDGTTFDSSIGAEPLQFTLGKGQVIPGFEEALLGLDIGDSKVIQIAADAAYGPHLKEMIAIMPRDQFPPDLKPEVGMQLQMNQSNGQSIVVTVTEVTDTEVTIDGNHPLAGKDLTFDLQLVEIA